MRATFPKTGVAMTAMIVFSLVPGSRPASSQATDRLGVVLDMYERDRARHFPEVRSVQAAELVARMGGEEWVLVDVREPEERAVSTLPGAVSAEAFETDPERWAGRPVVAYCTIGYRSGLWAKEMAQRGVEVLNLAGSLLAWTHAGGELVAPDGTPTRRLHVYGRRWNLAAEGYETVW